MSLTKLYKPSETALRQFFNRQFFLICVLSWNKKMAPNSAVSHEFSFKTYKISEQQINPKVLSVASSCHYNGNVKKGKTNL